MLQSKYLTREGLTAYLNECYRLGFNYVFYNTIAGCYSLSKEKPVFEDGVFLRCMGVQHFLRTYFSELVFTDLLYNRPYLKISDYIDTVDWSKVPIDTKVMVSDDGEQWKHRHFARCINGRKYTYATGKTSFTAKYEEVLPWNMVKLAEETNE